MNILAVDTSTRVASVALSDGWTLLSERTSNNRLNHSVKLMGMIDEILKENDRTIQDIDIFAVATGPGSFTGLRIGLATVKGLASVGDKPVAAVTTLESLAENFLYSNHIICPMLDARNRQVYAAAYRTGEGRPVEVLKIAPYALEEYLEKLAQLSGEFLFCGDAAGLYQSEWNERLSGRAALAPLGALWQRASSLCQAAIRLAEENRLSDYRTVVPTYFKASQPEREAEK